MSGKETEAAISEYEAIIAAGPGAAWLGLDVAYIGLAQLLATGPAEVRDPARVVELARKAVEINDVPDYRLMLAAAFLEAGETEAAISEYEAIIAAWPGYGLVYRRLARLLATGPAEVRNAARAVEFARKAVKTNDDPNYRFALATALEEAGENEAAIAEYEAIIAAVPEAAWPGYGLVYHRLARLLATGPAEVRDLARAVEFARKAVEANDDPDYRFTLAAVLEEAGEIEAAITELETVIAAGPGTVGPEYGLAYNGLAWLLATGPAEVRNAARAVELARKAVEANDDPDYRFTLATALEEAGETEAAIAEYEAIIAAAPEYGLAYNGLAWLLATGPAEVRNAARAVELARKTVEISDDPDYRDTLAAALAGAGETEAAIAEYEAIIAARPEYFVKWYHPALKQHGYGETVDGVYDEAALQALHACVRSGCQMVLADGE